MTFITFVLSCIMEYRALCIAKPEDIGKWLQLLLKEKCMNDEKLFASFLNRLFNTLNWTITEFSITIKEMQEHSDLCQVFYLFLNFLYCPLDIEHAC